MEALDHYLAVARDAVADAHHLVMKYFANSQELTAHRKHSTDLKTHNSPVTEADSACESLIRNSLKKQFPDHAFIGEEGGSTTGSSSLTRYIDPIDGTREFIRGTADRGILLALFDGNEPIVAVSHIPVIGETITATTGGGARCNGVRLQTSATKNLSDAYIAHERHKYFQRDAQFDAFLHLCNAVDYYKTKKLRDFHYLVQGKIDAVIGPKTHLYDIAPFVLMTQEAGGRVTTLTGERITEKYSSYCMSNGQIHDPLLSFFA